MLVDDLEWLGHAGFRLRVEGVTVYIDPYRVEDGPPGDLILITHEHYDHFAPLSVERLSHDRTWVVAPAQVAERISGQVASVAPGETIEAGGIDIRAIAAYNTSKRDGDGRLFHPPEAGCVGFELRIRGERLYHSGDTDVIPEMDEVAGCDVALLPVSGRYVMTPAEAAEAARRIGPAVAVPMHWGGHVGARADAEAFATLAKVPVRILEPVT